MNLGREGYPILESNVVKYDTFLQCFFRAGGDELAWYHWKESEGEDVASHAYSEHQLESK